MKRAGVYHFKDQLIVSPKNQTVDGIWEEQCAFLVEDPESPSSIGSVLRKALDESRQGVPKRSWESLQSMSYPALEASGVKTNSAFMKSAKYVAIGEEEREITITPYANKGARGGFTALKDKAQSLTAPDDAALGAAVLAAFADTV